MNLTPYHAKYFAYELTQRIASKVATEGFDDADNLDKITASLSDAQVDLNPHQVDAALFALRSPLSQGVILADEVGLGKTIEAGIVISQRWAERKRQILIIAPANLRKQWSQELFDKFFLPSLILEKKSFDAADKNKKKDNPFYQTDNIVICSYQFARAKEGPVSRVNWDLVVIDEAHRLRNVYRKDNKIGNALKAALFEKPKILLTATPLQNSLLELYGLVSLVDDYIFGDLRSFKQQYSRITSDAQFLELKQRIAPVCKRTLRAQVREYIRYTNRICLTREFSPNDDEHELYMSVSEYLRKENLYALPKSQRQLMTLILRKLLASSSFAIADTFKGLCEKLEKILLRHEEDEQEIETWEQDFETTEEIKEEWNDDPDFDGETIKEEKFYTPQELEEIKAELEELSLFYELAKGIQRNSKGDNLIEALKAGFEKLQELGAAQKAVIFTESVRTQQYIREILEKSGHAGKIVLFNGSNNDADSTRIYHIWLEKHKGTERISGSRAADIRAALTEHFRDEATILIATEAAAEGINLQFCSLVVNYDLPWNPQRIEQRIGRCHRYGQRFDVVVINFLNDKNAADKRVYELLNEKFKLFDGVFGASDDVLGTIESGVDFEKRIIQIYQNYRSEAEIKAAFDQLKHELEESINERMDYTHQQLMENFDEEVLEKIKIATETRLDAFEKKFWNFSRFALAPYADDFDDENCSFHLKTSPTPSVAEGNFRFLSHRLPFDRLPKDAQMYRIGHPLARHFVEYYKKVELPCVQVVFNYTDSPNKITILQRLVGTEGWLRLDKLTVSSLEEEDFLLFAAMDDEGTMLDHDESKRLFSLLSSVDAEVLLFPESFNTAFETHILGQRHSILQERNKRDGELFTLEMDKLDRWSDDQRLALHAELRDIEQEIRLRRNLARQISVLAEKVKEQRAITELEKRLADKRLKLHAEEDNIEKRKNEFLDTIEKKLDTRIEQNTLFRIRWKIV